MQSAKGRGLMTLSPAKHEASIREAIILSVRRMVAGIEVTARRVARGKI